MTADRVGLHPVGTLFAYIAAEDVVVGIVCSYVVGCPLQQHAVVVGTLAGNELLQARALQQSRCQDVALKDVLARIDRELHLVVVAHLLVRQVGIAERSHGVGVGVGLVGGAAYLVPVGGTHWGTPNVEGHVATDTRHTTVSPLECHLVGDVHVLSKVEDVNRRLGVDDRCLDITYTTQDVVEGFRRIIQFGRLDVVVINPCLRHVGYYIFIIAIGLHAAVVAEGIALVGAYFLQCAELLPVLTAEGVAALVGLHTIYIGHRLLDIAVYRAAVTVV